MSEGTVKKIGETVYLGTFKNKDEAINCRLNYELNNNIKNKYNELNKL